MGGQGRQAAKPAPLLKLAAKSMHRVVEPQRRSADGQSYLRGAGGKNAAGRPQHTERQWPRGKGPTIKSQHHDRLPASNKEQQCCWLLSLRGDACVASPAQALARTLWDSVHDATVGSRARLQGAAAALGPLLNQAPAPHSCHPITRSTTSRPSCRRRSAAPGSRCGGRGCGGGGCRGARWSAH